MIKSWLDIAPQYIDFILKFVRLRMEAFEGRVNYGKVSSDLTSLLIGGVVLSYLFILVAEPNLHRDSFYKILRGYLNRQDLYILPVFGLLCIIALGILSHTLVKIPYVLLARFSEKEANKLKLRGSLEDTINAALAFGALFIPLLIGYVAVISYVPSNYATIAFIFLFPIALSVLIYYPWAMMNTHPHATLDAIYRVLIGNMIIFGLPYFTYRIFFCN